MQQTRSWIDRTFWYESEGFNRFRGNSWMKEPCRSCPEQETGLVDEIPYVRRAVALRHAASLPETPDDDRLLHLVSMFEMLNECGIKGRVDIDQAHDPINRDTALRQRYAALRA